MWYRYGEVLIDIYDFNAWLNANNRATISNFFDWVLLPDGDFKNSIFTRYMKYRLEHQFDY